MTDIGRTLLFPSQMICMDSKTRDILSIYVISADLRINSARKFSGMEHHLRLMCFRKSRFSHRTIVQIKRNLGNDRIVLYFLSNILDLRITCNFFHSNTNDCITFLLINFRYCHANSHNRPNVAQSDCDP